MSLLLWSDFWGSLHIADLGYFVPVSFKKIISKKGYFISRYKSDTNVYDADTVCEFYAKLIAIVIFHGIANCAEIDNHKEFSLVKAMINFKKRAREMVFVIRKNCEIEVSEFIKRLVNIWEKFAIKDRYRKKRISTLQVLKYSAIQA